MQEVEESSAGIFCFTHDLIHKLSMSHHIFPVDTFSIWRNVCVQGHKSVLCSCDIESQAHNELIHCYRVRRYMLAMFIVLFPKGPGHQGAGKGHQLLQEEVQAGDEEKRVSRAVGLRQQGAWTRWESTLQRQVIMQADFHQVRFLVQEVYSTLPSPVNLHVGGKSETSDCLLCSRRGTLEHLLRSCRKALADGRYCWRHNQVLRVVPEQAPSRSREGNFFH